MSDLQPSITFFDPRGGHTADLAETRKRLKALGSWKRQRIVMLVPAEFKIPGKVAMSWMNMMFPPNNVCVKALAEGLEVGHAYSQTIEQVLGHPDLKDFEYVLTIEQDNTPPPDGVILLLESMEQHPELSCISGVYFTKGPGGHAQIWGDPNDPVMNFRPQVPKAGELQECNGTGMGFALWRLPMFKDERIPKPWFRTKASKDEGIGTQDLAFWTEARKLGYRCAVDNRCRVGHYDHEGKFGPAGIVW